MGLPDVASGTLFSYAELSLDQDYKTLFTRLLKSERISIVSTRADRAICSRHATDYFYLMPEPVLMESPDTVSPQALMANVVLIKALLLC